MRYLLALTLLAAPAFARAQETEQAKPAIVPYRLTDTQHVLVRIKLNGKGPFNFVVDTGCPVLVINTPVAKKAGLAEKNGVAVIDKLEFEGGLVQSNVKARVETPFQLEGMNGMGLAGLELHGLLGYTVLAKYKLEFDFTRDQLKWLPLNFTPPPPQALNIKGGSGGLEMMAGLMKFVSFMAGLKPAPPPVPRGFLGFEMEAKNDALIVRRVLAKSPAAEAGLKAGDRIDQVNGAPVTTGADVEKQLARLLPGQDVRLNVVSADQKRELKITAADGL
jgi:serine protease DegQ